MAALMNLNYPIVLSKCQIRPRVCGIRCSVRVFSSLSSRRSRRRNSLRPKILKTLTKPYPTSFPDSIPEDLGTRVEPDIVIPLEAEFEKSGSRIFEELETSVGVNKTGLGFEGFSGRTVFKVVASFVGLFVLQTVVSVWIMGSGNSSEKDGYGKEVGFNGSAVEGGSSFLSENGLKIDVIRRMAREVREAEKRKRKMENGETDLVDESDGEEDDETDNSSRNGIAKEIDGRLTTLRKRSSIPVPNVNFSKNAGGYDRKEKNEGVDGKEGDNRLMFEAKRKFRSQMTSSGDKPKGFEGIDGVRGKGRNTNDLKSEWSNNGMGKDVEKPASRSSAPILGFKKSSASEEENLGEGINGSSSLKSDSSINGLSVGMSMDSKPKNGVLQDSSNTNTLHEVTELKESSVMEIQESKIDSVPTKNEKSDSGKLKSNLSRTNKDKKNNDAQDIWWSNLPYVFAILMQKGLGSDAQQKFYSLHIDSDRKYESSYTVAFEDQNDARNLCYILDSVSEDPPNGFVDIILMSTKELKEIIDSLKTNVAVVRKGTLKLYAGQPLDDAESAMRLLLK